MAQEGESGQALAAARAALAARIADLADADRAVIEAVAAVHTVAAESIARIEAIRADIDAAAAGQSQDSPAAAHELSRLLVAKQREIAAAVIDARAVAESKTAALQQLMEHYRSPQAG
jgi:hypothetical protein